MAGQMVRIRRSGVVVNAGDPDVKLAYERIQKRLHAGSRPVWPVVVHFAGKIKQSVDFDFKVGGRSPFAWKPNRMNTIVAKGHGRQLVGKGGPKMQRGISYTVAAQGATTADIHVASPFPGELHQQGRKGPWVIRPRRAKFLRFVVAESQKEFKARRRRAIARRRAGTKARASSRPGPKVKVAKVRVPSRPGKKVVFAKFVIHPGFPARKFVVIREGLLREGWRKPLRAFLFDGVVPKPVSGVTG